MFNPDVLLSDYFIYWTIGLSVAIPVIFWSILLFVEKIYGLPKDIFDKLATVIFIITLVGVIVLLTVLLNFKLPHTYQLLRQQSSPPTWETVQVARDFNIGQFSFSFIWLFLYFYILTIPAAIILFPLLAAAKNFLFFLATSVIFGVAGMILFYALTFHGNCFYYWVNQEAQYLAYKKSGPPITFSLYFEEKYGNRCGAINVDSIKNISNHYFVTTPITSFYFKDELERLKHEDNILKFFSRPPVWLSPTADILGVYGIYIAICAVIAGLFNSGKSPP